jgi:hypothetical protein
VGEKLGDGWELAFKRQFEQFCKREMRTKYSTRVATACSPPVLLIALIPDRLRLHPEWQHPRYQSVISLLNIQLRSFSFWLSRYCLEENLAKSCRR